MKCQKCQFENIISASYCQKCGAKFSEAEKDKAYKKTIYGKIDSIKKIKDILTLNVITSSLLFKIISLLVVLGIGLYFLISYGMNTKILNSKDYQIFYNKEAKEYYLLIDDNYNSINVSLYRPNRIKKITIYHYNEDDTLISNDTLKKDDLLNLNASKDDYYVIKSTYNNKSKDDIKVFVYHNSDI